MKTLKMLSPVFYLVVIISFFMPFIEISCQHTSLGTLSGYTVMTGSAGENLSKTSKDVKTEINLELVVVFVTAILGLVLTIFKNPKLVIASALTALIGFVFLMIFRSNLQAQVQTTNQFMQIIQVHYKLGYWLCFIFLLVAVLFETIYFFTTKKESVAAGQTFSPINPPPDEVK